MRFKQWKSSKCGICFHQSLHLLIRDIFIDPLFGPTSVQQLWRYCGEPGLFLHEASSLVGKTDHKEIVINVCSWTDAEAERKGAGYILERSREFGIRSWGAEGKVLKWKLCIFHKTMIEGDMMKKVVHWAATRRMGKINFHLVFLFLCFLLVVFYYSVGLQHEVFS